MADYRKKFFFQRLVYKQKLFSVTKLPILIKKKYKTVQKAFGIKPGALGHCYSLLIWWFNQFKKNTNKSKGTLCGVDNGVPQLPQT